MLKTWQCAECMLQLLQEVTWFQWDTQEIILQGWGGRLVNLCEVFE